MKKYLLDSNIFIEAHKRYYQKKIVPSFWEFLNQDGHLFTLKQVKDEINAGRDNLPEFIKDVQIFNVTNLNNQREIPDYIQKKYSPEKSSAFFNTADFLLVCVAKDNDIAIVTHEKLLGENTQKISIPNICEEFNINYIDTFTMLRELNINLSNYKKE